MQSVRNTADRPAAKRGKDEGFTLIELLVVIVILGVLAAVVVFSVGGLTDRGAAAACKSDVKTVEIAVEAYRAKLGLYPNGADSAARYAQIMTAPNAFIKNLPAITNGYVVTIADINGTVTATPLCTAL